MWIAIIWACIDLFQCHVHNHVETRPAISLVCRANLQFHKHTLCARACTRLNVSVRPALTTRHNIFIQSPSGMVHRRGITVRRAACTVKARNSGEAGRHHCGLHPPRSSCQGWDHRSRGDHGSARDNYARRVRGSVPSSCAYNVEPESTSRRADRSLQSCECIDRKSQHKNKYFNFDVMCHLSDFWLTTVSAYSSN